MLNLAGKSDGIFVSSLKPWINVMTNLAARVSIAVALFTGISNPNAIAQTQTGTPFATGVTEPLGGLVLSGTAINPQTQKPYRHLWNSDQAGFGLCRLDPDVDTPGPHAININTCLPFVGGAAFKPGQLAFDPASNNIYAVNLQAGSNGVYRLHFVPGADSGHGGLDLLHQEILAGGGANGGGGGGGGGIVTISGCTVPGSIPNSASLGPDGNLYIGFKASGNIVRINSPQSNSLPCSNIQLIGSTADQSKNFGLGWIGHDLFGGDGLALWTISNADQCMTPQNGQNPCRGHSILTAQTATPSFVMTDQIYPDTGGTNIYVATPASLTLLNMVTLQATQDYATGFEFLGGLTIDPTDLSIYAADDPTAGKLPVQGRWWALGNGPANGGRPGGTLTEFASGVTEPIGGVVLSGTAINPDTGKAYRHLWTSDEGGFGLCRIDPDVDTPGPHALNPNTCLAFVAGVQFKPGELAFDPLLNLIYAVDLQANTQGIFRLHYLPDGDGGHGAVDPLHTEVLGGSPVPVAQQLPTACGIPGNIPNSAVLGPDGSLYIGFKASGNILRIASPQTEPLPCSNVQIIGATPDNRKDFGLGFIGHDLYGGDGLSAWIMIGADFCMQPGTGNTPCQATSILVPQTASPTYVITDQLYPLMNGRNLFVGKPGSITLVDTLNLKVTLDYATGFQFLSGMALDPTNQFLYAADDATAGKVNAQGHWWLVGQQPQLTPAAPGAPTNVIAIAGDGQASLSWSPAADGQPVTSFTVRNSFASDGALLPDLIVSPPSGSPTVPSNSVVTGLTNGIAYQFTVAASNNVGTSAFSNPSNTVTPQALSVPDPPGNVSAQPGNGSASISWTVPASNGGSPISTYTVSALTAGASTGLSIQVAVPATSTVFTGLTNGTTYTFIVLASNAVGNSANSAQSNAVTPTSLPPPPPAAVNVSVSISGPTAVPANSTVGYQILITNHGSTAVPQVNLTDSFSAVGATIVAAIPSQGTCTTPAAVICSLGNLNPGGTLAIGITQTLSATVTNSASIQVFDAAGNPLTLTVPSAGSASVTTNVQAPPPPPTPTPTPTPTPSPSPTPTPVSAPPAVTDLALSGQYSGSGSQGTISWQIQNLGAADATNVVFMQSVPVAISPSSLSAGLGGTCTKAAPLANQIRVICRLTLLPHGQSWSINLSMPPIAVNTTMRARVGFAGLDPAPANNFYVLNVSAPAAPPQGGGSGGGPVFPVPVIATAPDPLVDPPQLRSMTSRLGREHIRFLA